MGKDKTPQPDGEARSTLPDFLMQGIGDGRPDDVTGDEPGEDDNAVAPEHMSSDDAVESADGIGLDVWQEERQAAEDDLRSLESEHAVDDVDDDVVVVDDDDVVVVDDDVVVDVDDDDNAFEQNDDACDADDVYSDSGVVGENNPVLRMYSYGYPDDDDDWMYIVQRDEGPNGEERAGDDAIASVMNVYERYSDDFYGNIDPDRFDVIEDGMYIPVKQKDDGYGMRRPFVLEDFDQELIAIIAAVAVVIFLLWLAFSHGFPLGNVDPKVLL